MSKQRQFLLFLLLLIAIFTVSGCRIGSLGGFNSENAPYAGPSKGSIFGKVTLPAGVLPSFRSSELRAQVASGAVPVASATVWIETYPDITATTDTEGNYVLENLPLDSTLRVVAKFTIGIGSNKKTYKRRSSPINVSTPTIQPEAVDVVLIHASNAVSGILRDKNGEPRINSEIRFWGEAFFTDSNGRFELPGIPPEPEESEVELIEIIDSTGQTTPIAVIFTPAGTSFVELYLPEPDSPNVPPKIILLRETPSVSIAASTNVNLWAIYADPDGKVADFATLNWSISDGILASSSQSLPTSLQEGLNLFSRDLPKSKIAVEAVLYTTPIAEGYYDITVSCKDKGGLVARHSLRILVASPLAPPPDIPVNSAPKPEIIAKTTVVNNSNLELTVEPNDPDGNFGLSYLWSVSPNKGTFSNANDRNTTWKSPAEAGVYTLSCKVSDGELEGTTTHKITVIDETPVTSPGKITGYVRDVDTAQTIANALVAISGTDLFAISDENGRFEFNDLEAGAYTLIASRDGYQVKTFTGIVVPE